MHPTNQKNNQGEKRPNLFWVGFAIVAWFAFVITIILIIWGFIPIH